MKSLWIILIPVFISCNTPKPKYDVKAGEAAVRAVLEAEQIAWNNGDIDAFMQGYWKSDSLYFVNNRGYNAGWQATLDGYKKGYPDRAAMGNLHFDIAAVIPVGQNHFLVQGRYRVTRLESTLEGNFTLLFKKLDGKWVAVYDHTC